MDRLTVRTERKRVLVDVTERVTEAVVASGEPDGVWLLYVPHTTAGITINEGADPAVARDVLMAFAHLAPEDLPYEHDEGNSPAHVMSCLAGASALVAFEGGEPALGTWQSIFFCEFDGPRSRELWLRKL